MNYTIYACQDETFGADQRYWREARADSEEELLEILSSLIFVGMRDGKPVHATGGPMRICGENEERHDAGLPIRSLRVTDGGDFAVLEWTRPLGFVTPPAPSDLQNPPLERRPS